jgi:hypothetical protein
MKNIHAHTHTQTHIGRGQIAEMRNTDGLNHCASTTKEKNRSTRVQEIRWLNTWLSLVSRTAFCAKHTTSSILMVAGVFQKSRQKTEQTVALNPSKKLRKKQKSVELAVGSGWIFVPTL